MRHDLILEHKMNFDGIDFLAFNSQGRVWLKKYETEEESPQNVLKWMVQKQIEIFVNLF